MSLNCDIEQEIENFDESGKNINLLQLGKSLNVHLMLRVQIPEHWTLRIFSHVHCGCSWCPQNIFEKAGKLFRENDSKNSFFIKKEDYGFMSKFWSFSGDNFSNFPLRLFQP